MNSCNKFFATVLFSILLVSTNAFGQRVITLQFAKVRIVLLPGDRVMCKLFNGEKYVGTLQNITESTLDLGNKTLIIDSVKSIGRRKKIAPIFGYGLMVGSLVLNIAIVRNTKSLGTVALAGAATAVILAYVAVNPTIGPGLNHILHRTSKWRMQTIEFNKQ